MKTTSKVIEESGIEPSLIRSVVRQIGDKTYLEDVSRHGASGGFSGFTYYNDTVAFFKHNRKTIVALVERMADDLGENPVDMVAGFNCLKINSSRRNGYTDSRMTSELRKEMHDLNASISRCLYGGRLTDEDTNVANALAWFALEEVARAFCDE